VLGDPGVERTVRLDAVLVGRWPVTNAHLRDFVEAAGRTAGAKLTGPQLADHPATDVTFADAVALCAWPTAELGHRVRLPSGDEWEAVARGGDGRPWPWGGTFDPDLCACVEAGW